MNRTLSALVVSAVALPAGALAQSSQPTKPKPASSSAAAQSQGAQMPQMPKPGPEHDVLRKDVGTWDATVEMTAPDGQKTTSKGTETVSMIGFWQVSSFKGQMMGEPFQGLGSVTFDPTKKKYVGTWIDSMTPGYSTMEADLSADGRTMTGTMEGPDMSGKMVKSREVTEWRPDGTRVFSMYGPGDTAGKQAPMMTITYRKRGGAGGSAR
ncbi:MAG TPA: DUF1579 domain-containing protein [Vicinamibacteria bacterium]|nr:DUF1579 domain-containing protein [Vicinamibacteria bacterium]